MRRKDQPRILCGVFVGPSFAESLASFGKKLGEPARIAAFCFLVTQIDTQALLQGALTDQKQAQTLIGLVAEEGLEPPTRGL